MRLDVRGAASAELPLRVLNLLAQNGVVPERFSVERSGDDYELSVEACSVPGARAELILEKIRSMVLVAGADMTV
jgi:hypothetical protein